MASAPALAPIKALERLFLAMKWKGWGVELQQDTTVLQFGAQNTKMSGNRQSPSPFHNKWQNQPSSFSS
jgi:hypothetical protein